MLYLFRVCLKDPGWSGFSLSRLSFPMCFRRSPKWSLLTDFFTTFPPQFLIIVMQVVIALVVVFFIFNIPCDGPVLLFILLCLLQGDNYNDKKPQRSMIKTITLRRSWHELRLFSLNSLWHNRRRHEDGHKLLLPRPHGDTKYETK